MSGTNNFSYYKGIITQKWENEKVVRLTIATSEQYEKDGEKKTITSYVPCVAFGHEANRIKKEQIVKGDIAIIEAKTSQTSYEKDGKKVYEIQIVIKEIAVIKRAVQKTQEEWGTGDTSIESILF